MIKQLQVLQNKALRYISNSKANAHANPLLVKFKLLNVTDMVKLNYGVFMYQCTYNKLPCSFKQTFRKLQNHERNLNYVTNRVSHKCLKSNPLNILPNYWNSLSLDLKRCSSLVSFKRQLSQSFSSQYNTPCLERNCYTCNQVTTF